jgi:hypothetical protein
MTLKKKYGIVILLDALGSSDFNEIKIKQFLAARHEINEIIIGLTSKNAMTPFRNLDIGKISSPTIFTFGDTVVVTLELKNKKHMVAHLYIATMLMRRYLFHSLEEGILYRGCFSIGRYVADSGSNTIMGDALSDAANWYDQSEWMGLSSTPRTNTVLESLLCRLSTPGEMRYLNKHDFGSLHYYDVPMKTGGVRKSYVVNWPSAFFDQSLLASSKDDPEQSFLKILSTLEVPKGTEAKYENTKAYFYYVAEIIANETMQPAADATAD